MVTEIKKRPGCRQLTFSDGTELRVPDAMFRDFRVREGDPVDPAHYAEQISAHAYPYALERAGRALTARDLTEKELSRRLLTAGYPEETVARVVQALTEYRFVSDERYAERFVSARSARWGRERLESELRRKGVAGETAREAVSAGLSDEGEREAALLQAQKLALRKDLSDPDQRRRLAAALARRGFSWPVVRETLARLTGEDDSWEDE